MVFLLIAEICAAKSSTNNVKIVHFPMMGVQNRKCGSPDHPPASLPPSAARVAAERVGVAMATAGGSHSANVQGTRVLHRPTPDDDVFFLLHAHTAAALSGACTAPPTLINSAHTEIIGRANALRERFVLFR